MIAIIETLAALFAAHRIVPFFGAGCSMGHVHLDWDAVREEMAASVGISDTDHAAVASAFVQRFGRNGLADFLRKRLVVDAFDPEHGEAYTTMLGSRVGAMYTTNQDNVIELCFASHGHPLAIVVDIDDIARLTPGDTVLYKFHGSPEKPASIVFTAEDFDARGLASHHELDIRLRSDCLAKSLLFLGYSLRDPNVKHMLRHLRKVFHDRLPPSYLVQYLPDRAFAQELHDEFGIEVIEPPALYPHLDVAGAFAQFLTDLGVAIVSAKAERELAELFTPSVPPAVRVVTAREVDALDSVLPKSPVDDALRAFRATYDGARVHADFNKRVASQFKEICRRVEQPEQVEEVRGALFNLGLEDFAAAFEAAAAAHATVNILPQRQGLQTIFHPPTLKEESRVIVAAGAIELLREWGRAFSPAFYQHMGFWDVYGWPTRSELKELAGEDVMKYVDEQFTFAYQRGKTTYSHPLDNAERLAKLPGRGRLIRGPRFDEILKSMRAGMPKKFGKPYEG